MYSAHLAAAKGLPYVFAHHFSGQGTAEALAVYRDGVPAQRSGARAADLPDRQRVGRRNPRRGRGVWLLPNLQMMARLRTGQPLGALDLVEDAEAAAAQPAGSRPSSTPACAEPSSAHRRRRPTSCARWPSDFGVDEVMVNPVASARRGTDPATAPARETTLELLAKELF